jgi:hypothetical protein
MSWIEFLLGRCFHGGFTLDAAPAGHLLVCFRQTQPERAQGRNESARYDRLHCQRIFGLRRKSIRSDTIGMSLSQLAPFRADACLFASCP